MCWVSGLVTKVCFMFINELYVHFQTSENGRERVGAFSWFAIEMSFASTVFPTRIVSMVFPDYNKTLIRVSEMCFGVFQGSHEEGKHVFRVFNRIPLIPDVIGEQA